MSQGNTEGPVGPRHNQTVGLSKPLLIWRENNPLLSVITWKSRETLGFAGDLFVVLKDSCVITAVTGPGISTSDQTLLSKLWVHISKDLYLGWHPDLLSCFLFCFCSQ